MFFKKKKDTENKKEKKREVAIGLVGEPDDYAIAYLEKKTGEKITKVKKWGKTRVYVGEGWSKREIKIN